MINLSFTRVSKFYLHSVHDIHNIEVNIFPQLLLFLVLHHGVFSWKYLGPRGHFFNVECLG